MSISPNTNTIFDAGASATNRGSGQTRTGLSTQIAILVNGEPVGAIQSFGQTQQRSTKPITEVGTDGVIEIVPSGATQVTLSIQRMVFDGLSITEAFKRGFMNISAQRIPFDIVVVDRFSSANDGEATSLITVYKNCWFTNISKTYSSQDYVVSENASVSCETVYTTQGDGVTPVGGKGHDIATNANIDIDNQGVEASVDSGVFRGSMANRNIVDATY